MHASASASIYYNADFSTSTTHPRSSCRSFFLEPLGTCCPPTRGHFRALLSQKTCSLARQGLFGVHQERTIFKRTYYTWKELKQSFISYISYICSKDLQFVYLNFCPSTMIEGPSVWPWWLLWFPPSWYVLSLRGVEISYGTINWWKNKKKTNSCPCWLILLEASHAITRKAFFVSRIRPPPKPQQQIKTFSRVI